jgi:hypothetical protein
MAWGFFKKIGQGLSKAFNFVKDKVVKPAWNKVIKPAVKFAAPIVSKVAKGIAPMLGPEFGGIAEAVGVGADVAGAITGADMDGSGSGQTDSSQQPPPQTDSYDYGNYGPPMLGRGGGGIYQGGYPMLGMGGAGIYQGGPGMYGGNMSGMYAEGENSLPPTRRRRGGR